MLMRIVGGAIANANAEASMLMLMPMLMLMQYLTDAEKH